MLCDNSFSSGDNCPSVQSKMCSQKEESLRKGWIRRRAVYVIFCGFIGLREKTLFCLAVIFFCSSHFVLLLRDEQTQPFFLSFLEFGRGQGRH